mmetsp:Transcript_16740/g.28471  ORF Transcript_16740/g.28471 Transcript_16740/m.28471 type:complete len:207 (+) Transcript_16740:202-822(+)
MSSDHFFPFPFPLSPPAFFAIGDFPPFAALPGLTFAPPLLLAALAFRLRSSCASFSCFAATPRSTASDCLVSGNILAYTFCARALSFSCTSPPVADSYCLRFPLSLDGSCATVLSNRPADAVLTCTAEIAWSRYFLWSALAMPLAPLNEAACAASSRLRSSCFFCLLSRIFRSSALASNGSTDPSSPGFAMTSQSFILSFGSLARP